MLGHLARQQHQRVPAVAVAHGSAKRRSAVAADQDRRVWPLRWLRRDADLRELVVAASKPGPVRCPHGLDDLELLVGDGATIIERVQLQRLELVTQPPNSDAEHDSTGRELIDRCDRLGGRHRVAVGQHEHPGADPDAFGAGGQVREHAQAIPPLERVVGTLTELVGRVRVDGLEPVGKSDVVDRPEDVGTELIGDITGPGDAVPRARTDVRREEADLHVRTLTGHLGPPTTQQPRWNDPRRTRWAAGCRGRSGGTGRWPGALRRAMCGCVRVTGVTANLPVADVDAARRFYADYLGLGVEEMNLGWVARYRTEDGRASIQVVTRDATSPVDSVLSVHVGDGVEDAYAEAQRRGYEIVDPLTVEPWGVRRFFVRDPDGNVINVVVTATTDHERLAAGWPRANADEWPRYGAVDDRVSVDDGRRPPAASRSCGVR